VAGILVSYWQYTSLCKRIHELKDNLVQSRDAIHADLSLIVRDRLE
jgi:hypothetical protein